MNVFLHRADRMRIKIRTVYCNQENDLKNDRKPAVIVTDEVIFF